MPEIIRSADSLFHAEGDNWNIVFDLPTKGQFTLNVGSSLVMTSLPARIGNLSETGALTEKRRIHVSGDELVTTLNANARIPFGTEPGINREFSLSEKRLDILTDLVMRTSMPLEFIDAGGLAFSGKIKEIGLIQIPDTRSVLPAPVQWFEFADNQNFYSADVPPLSLLIVSEDGDLLEITTGEDFWRWAQAPSLNGKAEFRIDSADGTLLYSRKLYQRVPKDDAEPAAGRNWRMTYLVAWGNEKSRKSRKRNYKSTFDTAKFKWEKSRLALTETGKTVKGKPCYTSNAVINILKQWVRGELADLHKGDVLLLQNVSPVFCYDASHLKRSKRESLGHFTLPALLDFRRWAEKQLAPAGAELRIELSEDSAFEFSPSLRN